jgi:fructosamine-3-kinase
VVATSPVAGGDIATATRLRLSSGQTALMKTLPHAPEGFFEAEAAGLRWLSEVEGGVLIPEVLGAASDCVILAWVEQSQKTPAEAAVTFGQQLATTHSAGADGWGLDHDGFIGRLPLPNRTAGSWAEFYAVRRVLPYLKLARDRGAITDSDAAAVESVVGRFTALVPDETPSRLHGDLWNGNCLWGQDLAIHVIDPAAYGGHREVDLAMLHLFGLTHLPRAMAAYDEAHPLADGWEDRLGIHQLFPLLVHACMFGGGYGARAGTVASRYL